MPRIPYFDLEQASDEMRAALRSRRPLNIYRMIPHSGPAGLGFVKLGNALLNHNELDSGLRELVILRVGVLSNAAYELHQHRRIARRVGLSDEKIAGAAQGPDAPVFDELERDVLRFTDEVIHHVKASDALFRSVAKRLSHRQLAELIMTIGYYLLVCRFLENLEVEIEE